MNFVVFGWCSKCQKHTFQTIEVKQIKGGWERESHCNACGSLIFHFIWPFKYFYSTERRPNATTSR